MIVIHIPNPLNTVNSVQTDFKQQRSSTPVQPRKMIMMILVFTCCSVVNAQSWSFTTSTFAPTSSFQQQYNHRSFPNGNVFASLTYTGVMFCNYYGGVTTACYNSGIICNTGHFIMGPDSVVYFYGTVFIANVNACTKQVILMSVSVTTTSVSAVVLLTLQSTELTCALDIDYGHRWLVVSGATQLYLYDIKNPKNPILKDSIYSTLQAVTIHPRGISIYRGLVCSAAGICYRISDGKFATTLAGRLVEDRSIKIYNDYIITCGKSMTIYNRNFDPLGSFNVTGTLDILRSNDILLAANIVEQKLYILNTSNPFLIQSLNSVAVPMPHCLTNDPYGIYSCTWSAPTVARGVNLITLNAPGGYATFYNNSEWFNYGVTSNTLAAAQVSFSFYFGAPLIQNMGIPFVVDSYAPDSVTIFYNITNLPPNFLVEIYENSKWTAVPANSGFTQSEIATSKLRLRYLDDEVPLTKNQTQTMWLTADNNRGSQLNVSVFLFYGPGPNCPLNAECTPASFFCKPGYTKNALETACQPHHPVINSITPNSGFRTTGTDVLQIRGNNFDLICDGSGCKEVQVKINGNLCTDLKMENVKLVTCKTPSGFGANLNVTIQYNSTELVLAGVFSYKMPSIVSVSPNAAISAGNQVSISCSECGADLSLVTIHFLKNDSIDTCTEVKSTSLSSFTCKTPNNMANGIYQVTISVAGQRSEETVTYRLGTSLTAPITKNVAVSTMRNQQVRVDFELVSESSATIQFIILTLPPSGLLFQYDQTAMNLRGPAITQARSLPIGVSSVIYNPPTGFFGQVEFSFQARDIDLVSGSSNVTIDIQYRHEPPVIFEKVKTVNLGPGSTIQSIDLIAVCYDDSSTLQVVIENSGPRGYWYLDAAGTQRVDLQNGTTLDFSPSQQQVDPENGNKRTVQFFVKPDDQGGVLNYAQLAYHFRDGTGNRSVDSGLLQIQVKCPPDQYINCWSTGGPCKVCPIGARCSEAGSFLPYNLQGFYPSIDYTFLPCVPSDACPEGTPSMINRNSSVDFICKEGYTGQRCGQCANGYYKNAMNCIQCPTYSIHPALLVFIVLIILFIMFFLLNSIRKIDLGFIGILIAFCQSIAIFQTFPLRWPLPVARLFHYFSFMYFNIELTSPECFVANDFSKAYEIKWYGTMLLPLVVLGVIVILVILEWIYQWIKKQMLRFVAWFKATYGPFESGPFKTRQPKVPMIQKTASISDTLGGIETVTIATTNSSDTSNSLSPEFKPISDMNEPPNSPDPETLNVRRRSSQTILNSGRRLSSRQPLLRASMTKLGPPPMLLARGETQRRSRGSTYFSPQFGNSMSALSNQDTTTELSTITETSMTTTTTLARQINMTHILSGHYETTDEKDEESQGGGGQVPFMVTLGGIYLTMLKMVYINLSLRSLELYDCNPTEIPNYYIYQPESSRKCYDGWWYALLPFSILGIMFYVIGIPALFLALYFKRKQYMRIKRQQRTFFQQFIIQLTFKRNNDFKDRARYWDMVLMIRQLAIIICQLFFTNFIAIQSQLVIMVFVVFLTLHAHIWPFTVRSINMLEAVTQISVILILMAGIMFYIQELKTESELNALGYCVIVVIVGTTSAVIVTLMNHLRFLYLKYKKEVKRMQKS